jgi:hypothetical protein
VTSIQNILDRKRIDAIAIGGQTRSKTPPTGLGRIAAPVETNGAAVAGQ